MKSFTLITCLALFVTVARTQDYHIIPAPAEIKPGGAGHNDISAKTFLLFDDELYPSACFLHQYCKEIYDIELNISDKKPAKQGNLIRMTLDKTFSAGQYTLKISVNEIDITGSEDGVFYGMQSLIQLMPVEESPKGKKIGVPCIEISDQPRYPYRGMHLDVCRHFFPIDFLKKCIDIAAYHKLNYFHLHLTDDQGWRIEIKKYPELNAIGSWRNGTMIGLYPGTGNDGIRYGGYYTGDEIRDLVSYAQKRYITIVPEIEMPGHSLAALAAYPWLGCTGGPYQVKESWGISDDVFCAGNDSTFIFLENVLDEIIDLFPSPYIHIGGDECPKERWKHCPLCQQRIHSENLKNEEELQSYFIRRIEKYLKTKGKTIIGWDEILDGGVSPDAVVMSWRGDGERGCLEAAGSGNRVILTPSYGFYLDYPQTSREDSLAADWGGVTTVRKVYEYNPPLAKLSEEQAILVIGGQANLWTEYMSNPSKVEYMMLPRLSAVSEVLWSPQDKRNWDDFKTRMESQYKRYKLWGVTYNPALPDMK